MRILLTLATTSAIFSFAGPTYAETGFGSYFANQAPPALEKETANSNALAEAQPISSADDLGNIEPAAGDETTDDATAQTDAMAQEPAEAVNATKSEDLEQIQSEIKKALSP